MSDTGDQASSQGISEAWGRPRKVQGPDLWDKAEGHGGAGGMSAQRSKVMWVEGPGKEKHQRAGRGICPVCRCLAEPPCSLPVTHPPGPALLVSPCAGYSCPCSSGVVMRPPLFTAWTDNWLPEACSLFPRVQPSLPAHHPRGLAPDPDGLCGSCQGSRELRALWGETSPSS